MKVVEYTHYEEYCDLDLQEILDYHLKEDDYLYNFFQWFIDNKYGLYELVLENKNDDYFYVNISSSYKPEEKNKDGTDNADYLIEKIVYDVVNDYIKTWDNDEILSRMDCQSCYEYSQAKYEEYLESEFDRKRDEGIY